MNENAEATQQEKWIERRKRLALRKYGTLKDEIPPPRSFADSFNQTYSQVILPMQLFSKKKILQQL